MSKRLYVIINPKSGTGKPREVLEEVKHLLNERYVDYTLKVVADPIETQKAVRAIKFDEYGAIAVYGGDGTVIAIFKALYEQRSSLPLLVLPGGSANALARSLNMPSDVSTCMDLFVDNLYLQRQFGVALANDEPFILDLHFGIWADSIIETSQKTKEKIGQFAYALEAIKQLRSASKFDYQVRVDGQIINRNAYACLVANEGYHSLLGAPLFTHTNTQSWLQMAMIKRVNGFALLRWYALRRLGRQDKSVIATWRAKEIKIEKAPSQMFFDDDSKDIKLPLNIEPSPYTITIITPPLDTGSGWRRLKTRAKVQPYRFYDHFIRVLTGNPSITTSQIAPSVYVGGQYRRSAIKTLRKWGVTGVVNMRNLRKPAFSSAIDILNLPTPDHQAPKLEDLERGVEFIKEQLNNKGAVYIHCRLGEGRGPTMAAAYLISQGMRPKDAVAHIERFRRQSRPNGRQVRQLIRFEALLAKKKIISK